MRSYLSQDLSLPRPCVEGICLYVQGRTLKSCKDEYEDIRWAFNQGRPIQPQPPYSAPSKSVEKTFKEFGTLFPPLQLPNLQPRLPFYNVSPVVGPENVCPRPITPQSLEPDIPAIDPRTLMLGRPTKEDIVK